MQLDVKQYVDATTAHAEKRDEISVPTYAVVEDLGDAITDALIGNAAYAISHVVVTTLLVFRQEISKPELVPPWYRLRLTMLHCGVHKTTSLTFAATRYTWTLWWSANDVEVSCKAVRVFLLVRKQREVWMRCELRQ